MGETIPIAPCCANEERRIASVARNRQLLCVALHPPIMRMRSRPVAPVEGLFIELGRARAQVLQRHVGLVGLTRRIKPECVPADRTMMVAAEQPSGLDHGVSNRSAHLV